MGVMSATGAMAGAGTPASVQPVSAFEDPLFKDPESIYWPGAFWMWNAPLDPDTLRAQLRDMAAHGLRSVCALPMPRAFRPDRSNNSMDPDYLTPEYFDRVRLAVEEAARLNMNWWLYDEGGWPSGQAIGKVTDGHPELRQQRLVRERVETRDPYRVPQDAYALIGEGPARTVVMPGATWRPREGETAYCYRVSAGGYVDLLNPAATGRFIELTHDGYKRSIGSHFGGAVHLTFTDEPSAPNLDPPKAIPWSPGLDRLYKERFGRDLIEILPALFKKPGPDMPAEDARARVAFYDTWTARFREAYFEPLRDWCRRERLASGGHLNGEDETINAVRYGFGHALRQLRAMDVPGVDVIWRQLFPGRPNHHFPKYASSAAHQNGTRYAFSESFCVYGNGLTPAQMKWLVDYQYIRGINLLVIGCFPLSTRDHQMTGERPHFGPVDPLWDHLPGFNAYVARLGYALSVGAPKIAAALYYPVRDMWARGQEAAETVRTHDALAAELLARQCDFDLIDDDLLLDPAARVERGELVAGAMRYNTILCGDVSWMHPDALARLQALAAAGGTVLCVNHAPGTDGRPGPTDPPFCTIATPDQLAGHVRPTAQLDPPAREVRAAARSLADGEILALFNEGGSGYEGRVAVDFRHGCRLDPQTGRRLRLSPSGGHVPVHLEPGETLVLLLGNSPLAAENPGMATEETIRIDGLLTARAHRRFVVGDHDFERVAPDIPPAPFAQSASWRTWVGEDYSGEIDYTADVELPETWTADPMVLETGPIEYAATVFLDGVPIGQILWPPWRIELPPCKPGRHTLTIRVANTLANELTSDRVTQLWSAKTGPGWPSPYHKRAIEFERESRGGGLQGPIGLKRLKLGAG
jgi:hypothetical protein